VAVVATVPTARRAGRLLRDPGGGEPRRSDGMDGMKGRWWYATA